MTELYKRNGAVFVPVGITLEEVEKLIGKRVEHTHKNLKNRQNRIKKKLT